MRRAYLDFESRSAAPLPRTGADKYAADASTDILCTGFAFGDEPVRLTTWEELDTDLRYHVKNGGLVVAHNAAFEYVIWNAVGKRYGWPQLKITQMDCTMVRAQAMGLPAALGRCAAAMGIQQQKDLKGQRIMMKLSQPMAKGGWHEKPEDFEKLYNYCMQDVEVERQIDKRLLSLTQKERKLWFLDQRVNRRGVQADVRSAHTAMKIAAQEMVRLNAELDEVSNHEISTYNAHVQVKKYLLSRGIQTKGVAKDDVSLLLSRNDLPSDVRRVLQIRQEAAKSSTAKLRSLVDGACADQRVRGLYQFHGATTGRWSGRRLQTQNFPRPTIKQRRIDEVFHLLNTGGTAESIEFYVGPVLPTLSNCLRGFLTAKNGYDLMAMDFKSIEARVLAWLAGEESVLEIFRTHGRLYETTAGWVFSVDRDLVDAMQRQVGKVATLALGFEGGVGAFQTMAKNYGVTMALAFETLWESSNSDRRERALRRWNDPKSKIDKKNISKEEWLASELTKLAWREANPNIVAYWREVRDAAISAVREPGRVFSAGAPGRQVQYKKKGSFLFCRLPSGRALCYPYPEIKEVELPWGGTTPGLRFMGEKNHQWQREATYGGKLVENIVQGVARDVLAEAMIGCDDAFYPIVMHVHDEIVTEVPEGFGSLEELEGIVSVVPEWATDMPIAAEGWRGKRYRK